MKMPDPKYEVPEPSFPVVAAMARQMEVALLDRCYHVEIPSPGGETGRLRLTGNHSSINYSVSFGVSTCYGVYTIESGEERSMMWIDPSYSRT